MPRRSQPRRIPALRQHGLIAEVFDRRDTIFRFLLHQGLHASDGFSELCLGNDAPQDGHQNVRGKEAGNPSASQPRENHNHRPPGTGWLDNTGNWKTKRRCSTQILITSPIVFELGPF